MIQAPPTSRAQSSRQAALLEGLRQRIAGLERRGGTRAEGAHLPFGHPEVDARLPGGGLALGALHEVAGTGPDVEHGAAAALFVAGLLARLPGTVLWVMAQRDLFAPGLAGVGLRPGRVFHVEAGKPASVLPVMEEGLRERGLAGVVGEIGGRLTLTASRRLQLAAEGLGTIAVALRRSRRHDDPALDEPSAAATRWRVAVLPSGPALPHARDVPDLEAVMDCGQVSGSAEQGDDEGDDVQACEGFGQASGWCMDPLGGAWNRPGVGRRSLI